MTQETMIYQTEIYAPELGNDLVFMIIADGLKRKNITDVDRIEYLPNAYCVSVLRFITKEALYCFRLLGINTELHNVLKTINVDNYKSILNTKPEEN